MKIGDTVRHKRTGETMTVIEFSEMVCRCRKHKPSEFTFGITIQVWGAVCATGNLEVIEPASKQLELL